MLRDSTNTPALPEDFVAALRENVLASANFEKLSPSHRREYIQWISEAKQAATRQRRIDKAVAQIAEKGAATG